MDRTEDFTDLILKFSHPKEDETLARNKSMVKDINDEYTQEAYRIVLLPVIMGNAESLACAYRKLV